MTKGFVVSLLLAVLLAMPFAAGAVDPYELNLIDKYYSTHWSLWWDDRNPREGLLRPHEFLPQLQQAKIGNCKTTAPVYAYPMGDGDVIGKIPEGAIIQLMEWANAGSWCRILYNGRNNAGWVQARYIVPLK